MCQDGAVSEGSLFDFSLSLSHSIFSSRWVHIPGPFSAIIYVAALSEYNQNLYEDESRNCLSESLDLFDDICNSNRFQTDTVVCG